MLLSLAIAGATWAQSYAGGETAPKGGESTFLSKEDDTGFLGLSALDLSIKSKDELFEMAFSGKADLIVYGIPSDAPGVLGPKRTFFVDKGDLFVDAWVGKVLYAFVDARTDRGENPSDDNQAGRMEQYFLRLSNPGAFDISIQLGKFPGVIGNFIPRHDGPNDNFLRYPIVYDHPTDLGWRKPQKSNAGLIAKRDQQHEWDRGMPVIWGAYYATGGAMFGSWEFLNWRFAAMNTAPGDWPEGWALSWDDHEDKFNYMGRLGVVPLFGLEVGLNVSRGPYLDKDAEAKLGGKDRDEFHQILYGIDATYSMGDLDLYFEAYQSEWQAHNIQGDLKTWAWYVEGKYTFVPGFYGALRFGREAFSSIRDSDGERKTWDRDVDRLEIGAGYWLKKNLLLRCEVERNWTEADGQAGENTYDLGLTLSF